MAKIAKVMVASEFTRIFIMPVAKKEFFLRPVAKIFLSKAKLPTFAKNFFLVPNGQFFFFC